MLIDHHCEVLVIPAQTSAEDVLGAGAGRRVSVERPGDPEPVDYAVENIRQMLGKFRVFVSAWGTSLRVALGGKTFKLKFGHHGSNHPVHNLLTQKVEITAQNHGFCVDPDSLPSSDVEITHVNLTTTPTKACVTNLCRCSACSIIRKRRQVRTIRTTSSRNLRT